MMRCLSLSPLSVLFFFIFNSRVCFSSAPVVPQCHPDGRSGLFCFSSAPVVPQCHPDESSALLQFKGSFSPTSLFDACAHPTPWNESTDCCTWNGITCDGVTGHVIGLDLSCNTTLKGAISSNSSLFLLRHLQSLILWEIDFEGSPILPEFGQFKNLTILELHNSNFSGHVPLEISHLSKLVCLSLRGYYPDQLTIEEDTFKALAKNLTSLTILDFYNIDMSSVSPLSLTNLSSSLTSLYLVSSNLHGELPENMFQMLKLVELSFFRNHLNGQIPCSFFHRQQLSVLYLSDNKFSGQLPEVCRNFSHKSPPDGSSKYQVGSACTDLTILSLHDNLLYGTIPSWIYELSTLEYLTLYNNLFTGKIREFKSTSLQHLLLSENNFTGPLLIPSAPNLSYFGASKNQFSGGIPTSICNMTNLKIVDLSQSNLSGIIPQCLGDFSISLEVVDLRMNKLWGPIPATFSEGNSLKFINLNGNELEGPLSRSLEHCRNLEVLDVGNNRLRDTFPDWLESLSKLQVLVLRANKFNGSIGNPKTRSPFRQLRIMDISHNEFRGALPIRYIENFTAMIDAEKVKMEYMRDDFYFYSIMVSMKSLDVLVKIQTLLTTIDLSSNNFTDEIPQSIGRLESLKGLNFSHNKLQGNIPSSLGNLTNLEWLDLSFNELVGRIPNQLASIPWLASLNLSQNKLVGPIPSGRQFNTFNNDSYCGNPGLCGFPLSKLCGNREAQPNQGDDREHDEGMFDWKVVMMGYASGVVIGISVGYMVLFNRNGDRWFMKRLGRERRHISIAPLRGRSRRRN